MNFATRPGLGASAENRELTVVTWCLGDEQFWLVQSDVDRALWIDTLSTDERGHAHGSLLSCVDDFLITGVLMMVNGPVIGSQGRVGVCRHGFGWTRHGFCCLHTRASVSWV